MRKTLLWTMLLLLISGCVYSETARVEIMDENFALSICEKLLFYDKISMEDMADAISGVMPYRGSNTIDVGNNSVICASAYIWPNPKVHRGVTINGFVQKDNDFTIDWSDEIYIGMTSSELLDVFSRYDIAQTNEKGKYKSYYLEYSQGGDIIYARYDDLAKIEMEEESIDMV